MARKPPKAAFCVTARAYLAEHPESCCQMVLHRNQVLTIPTLFEQESKLRRRKWKNGTKCPSFVDTFSFLLFLYEHFLHRILRIRAILQVNIAATLGYLDAPATVGVLKLGRHDNQLLLDIKRYYRSIST